MLVKGLCIEGVLLSVHTCTPLEPMNCIFYIGLIAVCVLCIVQTGDTNFNLALEVLHLLPQLCQFTHGNSRQAQPPTEMNRKRDQVSTVTSGSGTLGQK